MGSWLSKPLAFPKPGVHVSHLMVYVYINVYVNLDQGGVPACRLYLGKDPYMGYHEYREKNHKGSYRT